MFITFNQLLDIALNRGMIKKSYQSFKISRNLKLPNRHFFLFYVTKIFHKKDRNSLTSFLKLKHKMLSKVLKKSIFR